MNRAPVADRLLTVRSNVLVRHSDFSNGPRDCPGQVNRLPARTKPHNIVCAVGFNEITGFSRSPLLEWLDYLAKRRIWQGNSATGDLNKWVGRHGISKQPLNPRTTLLRYQALPWECPVF